MIMKGYGVCHILTIDANILNPYVWSNYLS